MGRKRSPKSSVATSAGPTRRKLRQEVLKFVDSVRQELALEQAAQHNVNASLKEVDQLLIHRVCAEKLERAARHIPAAHTFRQRLRWLWSGTWAR
jgi:hypothetical protein